MTLTVELTPEQEDKLQDLARAAGTTPAAQVVRMIDEAPAPAKGLLPGETLLDALKRLGVWGAFEFPPRADGREWSEVEGLD